MDAVPLCIFTCVVKHLPISATLRPRAQRCPLRPFLTRKFSCVSSIYGNPSPLTLPLVVPAVSGRLCLMDPSFVPAIPLPHCCPRRLRPEQGYSQASGHPLRSRVPRAAFGRDFRHRDSLGSWLSLGSTFPLTDSEQDGARHCQCVWSKGGPVLGAPAKQSSLSRKFCDVAETLCLLLFSEREDVHRNPTPVLPAAVGWAGRWPLGALRTWSSGRLGPAAGRRAPGS